ncbi:MAG: exodeoxyribonuclease III [Acidiferrobacterales bacterium]|nr:exodeoxyribonuclease III [Acidiferrobacterales bacterium]
MLKLATWNVNSLKVRLTHVSDWCLEHQPDVVCLQETKTIDENFPQEALSEIGFTSCFSGQKTYNGVATLVRGEVEDVVFGLPGYDDPQKRVVSVTANGVRVINVYVPNGKQVDDPKYFYKLEWFSHLAAFVEQELSRHDKLVVTGDFNIAPADEDVHDPQLWKDKILCSKAERDCLRQLVDLGLTDAFRDFDQPAESYSWWDYRAAGFRRNLGLRIDLIMVSEALRKTCSSCTIDIEPRKLERPSDHTPVIAQFAL